jgi:hypothetical protein
MAAMFVATRKASVALDLFIGSLLVVDLAAICRGEIRRWGDRIFLLSGMALVRGQRGQRSHRLSL